MHIYTELPKYNPVKESEMFQKNSQLAILGELLRLNENIEKLIELQSVNTTPVLEIGQEVLKAVHEMSKNAPPKPTATTVPKLPTSK